MTDAAALSVHPPGASAAGWPPCPAPFNLAAHALAAADVTPDKVALVIAGPHGAERWSHARLAAAVRGTGGAFLGLGLKPGDRVLIRLGNTVDFPIVFLGAIAAGLVPVPTSAQLTPGEVERIAAETAPALIAAAPGVALPPAPACPVLNPAELAAARDHAPCDWAMGDPDRLAYLVYTSGTSGQPRAVAHAHRALWARGMMRAGWYGLTSADRVMHAGSFNWTYTLGTGLLDPWSAGATAVIPAPGVTPDLLPLLMKRHDATIFAAAPGIYRQMLRAPFPPLPRLRHGLSAGETLACATRAAWEAATGTQLHEALGMTECSTFVSGSPARPAPPGAIGYPQDGRLVAVLGSDGAPVPRGQPGTLAVHRTDPGLFLGYWGQPDETAARFRGDWFLTGDIVAMAEDGAVTHLGRDDDMMNAGGYRVAPGEVEAAMATFPGLGPCAAAEVAVKPGVTVIALFHEGEADPEALAAHAAAHLARYKQPRLFVRLDALPRGANGKILRRPLRAWKASVDA
jgi:acyl-coenzyme A synthetase/AMP-(fatty) acid ligase